MDKIRLVPHEVILVGSIPSCFFCEQDGIHSPAPYDFATRMGPWANACEDHWIQYRAASTLGTGKGQMWVTEDQVAWTELEAAKRKSQAERAGS